MSWVDRVQRDFTITCGDGSKFSPQWLNATKQKEYNVTEFTFPNVAGSLVERREPKGRKYGIEIYFQGDSNIDVSNAFETAADDKRAWTISHPYYDNITVQPLSLNFDNTKHNLTKITGTVIETITDENPKTSQNPTDAIIASKANVDEISSIAYQTLVIPEVQDINQMQENNQDLFNEGEKIIDDNEDFENYFNAFNTANGAIINATSEPLEAINTLQTVINQPALFQSTVRARITTLVNQFNSLVSTLENASQRSLKILFENNATNVISSMCVALVTDAQYSNRNEVLDFVEILNNVYDSFIGNLDNIQSENANAPTDYVPDFNTQLSLNNLVSFTTSQLFVIAIDARQEREIILEEDSNVVLLTHRLFGLDVLDENIDEFMNVNEIGLNEYLQIKKGRKIIYFIQ